MGVTPDIRTGVGGMIAEVAGENVNHPLRHWIKFQNSFA